LVTGDPEKKKLHHATGAWAVWTIDAETPKNFGAKPNDSMNSNSRTRKGPAVLFLCGKLHFQELLYEKVISKFGCGEIARAIRIFLNFTEVAGPDCRAYSK